VTSQELASTDWDGHISQLKQTVNSNVLPLGLIKTGFFCHRALLFKVRFCTCFFALIFLNYIQQLVQQFMSRMT